MSWLQMIRVKFVAELKKGRFGLTLLYSLPTRRETTKASIESEDPGRRRQQAIGNFGVSGVTYVEFRKMSWYMWKPEEQSVRRNGGCETGETT